MCRSRPLAPSVLALLLLAGAARAQEVRPDLGDCQPCDTWVALADSTAAGVTLLGKNSDRPLFDCQPLVFAPRQTWPAGAEIDLGRLRIPQVEETCAVLGSSPYWCWGFEEGINEFGVAIGNEGIWTKVLWDDLDAMQAGHGPTPGPTGMDLLRLGLERGRTAADAVAVITGLLEKYGQFGSGIPTAPPGLGAYDNSYIVADPDEAYILETAGTFWAVRQVRDGTASISNVPGIRAEHDTLAPGLVAHAVTRGWWPEEQAAAFDFFAAVATENPSNAGSNERAQIRAACSARLLLEQQGAVTVRGMMAVARDRSSDPSIDLDQTASGCVAVLTDPEDAPPVFWWTPATPSNGCYVPFFVSGAGLHDLLGRAGTVGRRVVAPEKALPDHFAEESYWWRFRELSDLVRRDYAARNPLVRAAFDPLEQAFADGLPAVLDEATELRRAGDRNAAASRLARYSEDCLEQVLPVLDHLRERFRDVAIVAPPELRPFVGRYLSRPGDQPVTVLVKDGALALELPTGIYALKDPDTEGWRAFTVSDQVAVRFDAVVEGAAPGMTLRQGPQTVAFVRGGS